MANYKSRLERLESELGPGEEDAIVVITLTWPDEEHVAPIVHRRGQNGQLMTSTGLAAVPNLKGCEVVFHWQDETGHERI